MKYWEKFLAIIFNPLLYSLANKKREYAFENFLRHAFKLLDESISDQLKNFTLGKFSKNGGFENKAGNPDVYYSVFGYFISEALSINEIEESLRKYIKEDDQYSNDNSVHVFCKAILYSQLNKKDSNTKKLRDRVIAIINNDLSKQKEYNWFLGFLALYYLEEYYALYKLLKKIKAGILAEQENLSITHLAVNTILMKFSCRDVDSNINQLMSYKRQSGGFAAFKNAPFEDLLSTAVALYTLCVCGADLRIIKPQSLEYITSLYDNGGFCATELDPDTDIEYTFYGLLALASLAYENK